MSASNVAYHSVHIPVGPFHLEGDLAIPKDATGIVLFAHGSGSSRLSRRNRYVAELLQARGLATLLFDLLTSEEGHADDIDACYRFDIPLLTKRLVQATDWVLHQDALKDLHIGYFGASTGAAAALLAAVERPEAVKAVVSRGGRPDLALHLLDRVQAPTLLIVGDQDREVLALNRLALERLNCEKQLITVPGATHLFQEAGTLNIAAGHACDWLLAHLAARATEHVAILQ